MQTTEKTYHGFTAGQLRTMNMGQLLEELICPPHRTAQQRDFLWWICSSGDYYVMKLLTREIRDQAAAMHSSEFNYSNADSDWRQWVYTFVLERVPARIWWAYAVNMAQKLDEA
jgi:hypothetical protein